tara:strand:+ start:1031 stop:2356 length:1326 start_codon:yes stop_codon:yes gene_type:complete
MTVTAATTRDDFIASSGQTVFPYTFTALAEGDIKVLQNGVTLSLGSNYTLSGIGSYGGNVTLTTGATLSDKISVYLDMDLARTTNYQNSGDFLALDVNGDFDALWLALQQGITSTDRSVRMPNADPSTINMVLPVAATRANKLLTFDSTGAVFVKDYVEGELKTLDVNVFSGDGTTTTFTLTSAPTSPSLLQITIDGIMQQVSSYTVSGNNLTFYEAPPLNASVETRALVEGEVNAADTTDLNVYSFTGNGTTTAFTMPEAGIENNVFIYIDGVYQSKATYSISGPVVTFSQAPPLNSAIEMVVAAFIETIVNVPADGSVTTPKLADLAVTTAKIADGSITSAKLGAGVGGAFNDFAIKTLAYTAVTRDQLIVNSASAVTITLPASPTAGNVVFIKNAGAGTVTVGRNGSNINSTASDGSLAADAAATLVFVDVTIGWKEL